MPATAAAPGERAAPPGSLVREVGPHAHAWAEAGRVADQLYQACTVCGARRVALRRPDGRDVTFGPLADRCAQAAWLAGGEWVGEGLCR